MPQTGFPHDCSGWLAMRLRDLVLCCYDTSSYMASSVGARGRSRISCVDVDRGETPMLRVMLDE